jgi:hypothetical protein
MDCSIFVLDGAQHKRRAVWRHVRNEPQDDSTHETSNGFRQGRSAMKRVYQTLDSDLPDKAAAEVERRQGRRGVSGT